MRLDDDVRLQKDGYVCAQAPYLVHISKLELYRSDGTSRAYRLTGESFAVVRKRLGTPLPEEI